MTPTPSLESRVAALEAEVARLMALIDAAQPRRAHQSDVLRFGIPKALPLLQRKHPDGVTCHEVAAHFGMDISNVYLAVQRLVKSGRLKRVRYPKHAKTYLFLPDQEPPRAPGDTGKRRIVLETMERLSDRGRLEISHHALGFELAMDTGTLHYALRVLIRDGKVSVLRRAVAGKPTLYFIPSAIKAAA